MDNLVFEESINAEIEQSEFVQKKWIYVNDTNSQNYSTQVIIDTTPLANSGGYISWGEGYIVMPLILGMSSSRAGAIANGSVAPAGMVGLKNGFWQLINSFNVEYNNQTCVQQTAFTNVFRSFKAHTSFSQDDLKNEGATLGYYPDTSTSWKYTEATSVTGQGVSNVGSANDGFSVRRSWIYTAQNTQDALQSLNDRDVQFSSVFIPATGDSNKCFWKIYAKLRLKDLADFFGKTPLLKGSTIRLLINTNQVTNCTLTVGAGNAVSVTTNVLQGYTNPLLINPATVTGIQSLTGVVQNDTFTFSLSIFKDNTVTATGGQSQLTSCRLYAPVYKMNPIAEQRYLSLAPTKRVAYRDIFQYQFSNVENVFNILVSNGIPNIKSVLVVPFLAPSTTMTLSPHQSPFDTAGATPDPVILTNFNILVSGVNLFLQNQLYDYEQFNHELKSSNQLNGSLTTGLASGLISEQDFTSLYRYYYGNCSRILPSEEGVSRSISIIGQIKMPTATQKVNLMVFVEFEKTMTIDISTGARIEG